ncbi:unnamed protein product [Caenorhabditis angaria]|uniref:Uncharacterized protein n=1 Tax=Caenorhabditis angaria TaxID=860376 RepID=A0A9P1ICZ0_9PELO|nr:unnamed protein product [Caenorhabditis angaria]
MIICTVLIFIIFQAQTSNEATLELSEAKYIAFSLLGDLAISKPTNENLRKIITDPFRENDYAIPLSLLLKRYKKTKKNAKHLDDPMLEHRFEKHYNDRRAIFYKALKRSDEVLFNNTFNKYDQKYYNEWVDKSGLIMNEEERKIIEDSVTDIKITGWNFTFRYKKIAKKYGVVNIKKSFYLSSLMEDSYYYGYTVE